MKAITLWQPWASLVAVGAKWVETRSWSTKHRGLLAIHAAKRQPFIGLGGKMKQYMRAELKNRGADPDALPLGAVVAVVHLMDVVQVELYRERIRHLPEYDFADPHARISGPLELGSRRGALGNRDERREVEP